MSNFSKEQVVFFDKVLRKFEDQLVISGLANVVNTDQTQMARAFDTFWRPVPYIANSYLGTDATANFDVPVQMSVPAQLDKRRYSPFQMADNELRDPQQEARLIDACAFKLASDVNSDLLSEVVAKSTLFVKRASTASGFDDVAQCAAILNDRGVGKSGRKIAFPSRDYFSAASNLQQASRSLDNPSSTQALRDGYLGRVIDFDSYLLDYGISKTAAAGGGGITISTTYSAGGTGNWFQPTATNSTGNNVDNRRQQVTVSSTTSVVAGDSFTIANVNSVNMQQKGNSGQSMTFKVISVDSSTTMTISPPLINVDGVSAPERAYGNVKLVSSSGTAAITFLNTVTGLVTPFWVDGAVEVYPGRVVVPKDAGADVMYSTTPKTGFGITMSKQFDVKTMTYFCRLDILYGVGVPLPQMCGSMMFSQT